MRSVEVLDTTVLPPEPQSCRVARDAVRALCARARPPVTADDIDTAVLLTSELVSNAIIHTEQAAALAATVAGDVLRVAVSDRSADVPEPAREVAGTAAGGRGLLLVAELAHRWGSMPLRRGKSVWFELDLEPA